MREEADCLHLMVTVLTRTKILQPRSKDVDPSPLQVVTIAQDSSSPLPCSTAPITKSRRTYVTYRTANRDQIFRNFDEFVVPKAPQPAASHVATSFPPNSQSTQFLYQVCQNYPAETLQAIFPPGVHVQCRLISST